MTYKQQKATTNRLFIYVPFVQHNKNFFGKIKYL